MFKLGSIRKISVKNFITHSSAVLMPGPNLNLIIGPNGSGKSTIVAAIILGLGGNPKIIGRSTKLSQFIKHNHDEAEINIELQNYDDELITISRIFTSKENMWKINGTITNIKAVQEIIMKFNIQVNNLCQFLPQDRVQDFAKMDKQELLLNTLLALCRTDLVEKQKELIDMRIEHKVLENNLQEYKTTLSVNEVKNKTLEVRIENVQQKKLLINKVENIERKLAWLHYEMVRDELATISKEEKFAQQTVNKYLLKKKPLESGISAANKSIAVYQDRLQTKTLQVKKENAKRERLEETIDTLVQKVRDVKRYMETEFDSINQQQTEINFLSIKLEQLENDKQSILHEYGNVTFLHESIQEEMNSLNKTKKCLHDLEDKKEEINQRRNNLQFKLKQYNQELMRYEDVKQQRLVNLRKIDQETYNCVLWLREHKHLFKGDVFEPIMLEINVKNVSNAKFLENLISLRDKIAFTCELKEDMKLLLDLLREQQLTANVIHSGQNTSLSNFQPKIQLQHLQKYGIFSYLRDLIDGPEAIMKYLCKTYGLHNIPVGNAVTNRCFENMPKEIMIFFSDTHRFNVRVSHYSGERMVTSNEIYSNGSFSVSSDMEKISTLKRQMKEIEVTNSKFLQEIDNINQESTKISSLVQKCSDKLKSLRDQRLQLSAVEDRINSSRNQLANLSKRSTNKEAIKEKAQTKIKTIITEAIGYHKRLTTALRDYQNLSTECDLLRISMSISRQQVNLLENEAVDVRRECAEAQRTLDSIKSHMLAARQQAKKALTEAKALCQGLAPGDSAFERFQTEFESVSNDVMELKLQKNEILARADCIKTAAQEEINAFTERTVLINDLRTNIDDAQTRFDEISLRITVSFEEWLAVLNDLISKIDHKFSESFARMGCSGEVTLSKAQEQLDFDKYGLCIKVKFRDNEPLQELNRHVQSGGERAVSTAIFMLSLQELTPVPFRCVDEINQGMDSINERRMFNFLLETVETDNTPQYFLVTPKLVPKLKYGEKCMIHYVNNGLFLCPQEGWFTSNQSFSLRNSM